jgi:hypothetical protein
MARKLLRVHQFMDEIAAPERCARIEIIRQEDLAGGRT